MTIAQAYIGCDIAKLHIDVFDPRASKRNQHRQIGNTPAALKAFAKSLAGPDGAFVVFEATGAYDRALRQALAAAGIAFHKANPMQARRFAQAKGRLAKTDKLDAAILAAYGEAMQPRCDPPPDPAREELAAWVLRRDQLVAMRASEQTRLAAAPRTLRASLQSAINWLGRQIARADARIAGLTKASPALSARKALFETAPGVGPVTAAVLLAGMPELGSIGPKQAGALAGLAPVNQNSGAFRGTRRIRGGRRRVRQALFMAALHAKRHRRFRDFYDRVCIATGSKKAALIAVARKLITALNAMAKYETPFQP